MIYKQLLFICVFSFFFSLQRGLANTNKYRIILINNPSSSMTIAWNQVSGNTASVHYDVVDHGTNTGAYANVKTVDRSVNYRGMTNKFARLSGLNANTNYYFVVVDNEGSSQRFWFRTAPSDNSRLSFISGGDSRNNRNIRRDANTLVAKLKPHAVFFGGDMINSDSNIEWQEWFDDWQNTTASDGRMFPIVPTRGNHESSTSIFKLFDVPTADTYFAMTFGNNLIRTYTLNTNISVTGNQLTWLTNDLDANSAPNAEPHWKMIQYHKPMRPHTSGKSEGNAHYNAWAQLFYDKKVRLVIDCDSHMAKTTWPIKPSSAAGNDEGFIRDDPNGTIFAGEGCWGAPLRPNNDDKSWTRSSGSFNQFKLLFVDVNTIDMRTIKIENVASVGEVSNTDPFTLPANLMVWSPPAGAVVQILPPGQSSSCPIVGTPCDDGNPNTFADVEDGDCNCIGIPETGTLNYQVQSGIDDAEQAQSGGQVYISSTDLELVFDNYNSQNNQTVGIRFQEVHLPANANITNAYIQFSADEVDTGPCSLSIQGENNANALGFSDANSDITNRTITSASVSWNNVPAWNTIHEQGVNQRTPDLSTIVSEILQNPNWLPFHPMVFIITGIGARTAESFNGTSSLAPKLVIEYTLSPLPIELTSFSAQLTRTNQTHLQWTTETEQNNRYFGIERSDDGISFSPIGKVEGAGTSLSPISYEFLDKNPIQGDNYYRLKQVDYDGSSSISAVIHILLRPSPISWFIYPNPTSDRLFIQLAVEPRDRTIKIFDQHGRIVLTRQIQSNASLLDLSISHLPKGLYSVVLITDINKEVQNLVIE